VTERQKLVAQLVKHEGFSNKPYTDTVGKITIGVGRNLSDKGISDAEAQMLLTNDIDECIDDLATFAWLKHLNPVRQRVLLDMRFNLGPNRLREFKRTLALIEAGEFTKAAEAMLASKWATQVGRRATTLSRMMATGVER
jgi:lysozyme